MFKFVLLAAAIVAYAAAAGHNSNADDVHAEVKQWKSDVRKDGFDIALETSNHIQQHSSGDEHGNIHGSYEYITPEGEHVKVDYIADEHGYHPEGAVLPTPPPVPVYISKAIDYIRAHPPKEEKNSHH
ncbi:larval cuticle protein 2-like [Haematobia irritans]|uniref:larval cuticle protein 2-like n=1 Tax=Haematobia irritans TaxID=7368 RepID=UPI003F50B0DA